MSDSSKSFGFIGASAGGGGIPSVLTDDLTITGDGTITTLVKTSAQPIYTFDTQVGTGVQSDGIYIFKDGSQNSTFGLDNQNIQVGARVVVILDFQTQTESRISIYNSNPPYTINYQGVFIDFLYNYYNGSNTYEFIYRGNGEWSLLNSLPILSRPTDLSSSGFNIIQSGYYYFTSNSTPNDITLPEPANFIGQTILITNATIYSINLGSGGTYMIGGGSTLSYMPGVSYTEIFGTRDGWLRTNYFQI